VTHDELMDAAKATIAAVEADTSVDKDTTLDDLITLRDEVVTMIYALYERGREP
jgi:hypothetical protein